MHMDAKKQNDVCDKAQQYNEILVEALLHKQDKAPYDLKFYRVDQCRGFDHVKGKSSEFPDIAKVTKNEKNLQDI